MGRVTAIIYVLVICTIACPSWVVNHYHDSAITYEERRSKKVNELKQLTVTIADTQQRQRDVTMLDAEYSRELANAKAENETLRADIATGRKRLQVNVSCSTAVREAAGSISMDNATGPRLVDTAGRNYFILRRRLMMIQKRLERVQLHIREQCLK